MTMRIVLSFFYLTLTGLLALGCGAPEPTPTPDLVATQVAVEKAAAATLTAEAQPASTPAPAEALATATTIPTPTPSPTGPVAEATPTTSTQTQDTLAQAPLCTAVVDLNLRSGPGTVYEPPVAVIPAGSEVSPLAFTPTGFPGGPWIQVQVDGNQTGWLSADPQFVSCNVELTGLPAGVAPPTPTPIPTNTSLPPSPTPTRPLFAVVPVDGGQANLEGRVILPGYAQEQVTDPMVFRDKLVFRVEVYDPERGNKDGAGIDNVKITIKREDDNETVHERTERNPGYCVFGGGEPDCNVLIFSQNNKWPDSNEEILDGPYRAFMLITLDNGDTEEWNWGFRIERTGIKMKLVQIGPGNIDPTVNKALVFQVEAYDSGKGDQDGAGISQVDMTISRAEDGAIVHERTERNAGYCAFSGGEPDCTIWDFAQNGNKWPGGEPIESGRYVLRATAHSAEGKTAGLSAEIKIELP